MEPQTGALTQMPSQNAIIPTALISQKIFFVRGTRVMLDADLARLYAVATKNLNKAVKRNASRFPSDFMFQLSPKELQSLGFQSGTSKSGRGGRRYAPYAFTEQGVAMLSSVLRSSRAVHVNVAIMRTFVRLREMLATHEELRRKIDAMESGTTRDFKPFLRRFAGCWKRRFQRRKRLDFTPDLSFPQSLLSPARQV